MVETNVGKLLGTMWSLSSFSLIFVIARAVLKYRHGKAFGPDDWTLILSWCLLIIYTALITVSTTYGLGYHFVDIPPENLTPANKFLTIAECFAILALSISKTSFAFTLLRLVTRKSLKCALWVIIITLNIVMGMNVVINLISCRPVERNWNSNIPGTCWDPSINVNVSIFAGVYSGVMDLLLSGFPFLILRPLYMEKKEKCMICFAMSLGFFAGVTAFIKTGYLPQLRRWQDVTFSSYIILIWACAEACICIIATCIPYFRLAISHTRTTHRTGGYEIKDEEYELDRAVLSSKDVITGKHDWSNLSRSEGKRIAVPAKVMNGSEIQLTKHSGSVSGGEEDITEAVNYGSNSNMQDFVLP